MGLRVTLLKIFGWASLAVAFDKHVYTFKIVTGRSMQPTLNPDSSSWRDVVLFDRTVVAWGCKCRRGDIVALRSPIESKELIVKRIVALGGDVVQTLPPYPDPQVVVPEGYAWVEGDERHYSRDSNYFGPVPLALLEAKSAFILWPLSRFGPLGFSSKRARITSMHSPVWKELNDDMARERWRTARVHVTQRG